MNLTASKLAAYSRCAHSYELRYRKKVPQAPLKNSELGTLLHAALKKIYEIPVYHGIPSLENVFAAWDLACVQTRIQGEIEKYQEAGRKCLELYWKENIQNLPQWIAPVGTEGRMAAQLFIGGVRFDISGRYDRLDYFGEGLHLIDYKLSPPLKSIGGELDTDIQLGLYAHALEQTYGKSLLQVSHHYLKSGAAVTLEVTQKHRQAVEKQIESLARALQGETEYEPQPGHYCKSCAVREFCSLLGDKPAPAPKKPERIQLALQL